MRADFGALILTVGVCATAFAGSTGSDSPPDFDNAISIDSSGRGTEGNSLTDIANAAKAALDTANADAKQRNAVVPDAAYATLLQKEFEKHQPANATFVIFHETTDSQILANSTFDEHLKNLFSAIAEDPASLISKHEADVRVIGGWQIPKAIDVVGITQRVDDAPTLMCSGTVIANPATADPTNPSVQSPTRILTAAHCVCQGIDAAIRVGDTIYDPGQYASYLVRQTFLFGQTPAQSAAEHASTNYCPPQGADESVIEAAVAGRDLAVIESAFPIPLERAYRRKILSTAAFARWITAGSRNDFVRAVGYGFSGIDTSRRLTGSGHRLAADIATVSFNCTDAASIELGCKSGELVAAGKPFNQISGPIPDTCYGDSGGPIYAQIDSSQGPSLYTVGVASRGTSKNKPDSCGAGSIYALASTPAATAWLQELGAEFVQ